MLDIIFFALAGLFLILAIVGGVKPELFKDKKGGVADKKQIITGFTTFAVILFILGAVFTPSDNSSKKIAQMDMSIKQVTSMEAFKDDPNAAGGWVFAIKNNNSFEWKDCDLKLNDTYNNHLDSINIPKDKNDFVYLYESSFYKTDGIPFNPISQRPLKLSICCNTPTIDCYVGGWTN